MSETHFWSLVELEEDDPSKLSRQWTHLSSYDVIWMEDVVVGVRSGEHSATVSAQSSGPLPVNSASEATDASRLVSILPLFSPSVMWQKNKDGWMGFVLLSRPVWLWSATQFSHWCGFWTGFVCTRPNDMLFNESWCLF